MTAMRHSCDLLTMWVADPRIPIAYSNSSGEYVLTLNRDTRVVIAYCPFCGTGLAATARRPRMRKQQCHHLEELSRVRESPVIYNAAQRAYCLAGKHGIRALLRHCPVCGRKLPAHGNSALFQKISCAERAALIERCQGISTMEEALRILGSPDKETGSVAFHLYPQGRKVTVRFKRIFFYEHLADSVRVVIHELSDGSVLIKYHAKERASTSGPDRADG
jgi:hypothetical protein